jgi:Tol biopolymer transport system component
MLGAVAVATSGILAGLSGATVVDTASGARLAARPRTLVTTSGRIETFAQDGGRVAWIGRPRRGRCGLHVRTIKSGQTATTRLNGGDCHQFAPAEDLALAGRTAAWVEGYSGGNNERSWQVASATAGDRGTRRVDVEDVGCVLVDVCGGVPDPQPLLAGAGRLLVYYDGQGNPSPGFNGSVDRIRGGRAGRLFRTSGIVSGLAEGGGLIAAVSLSLVWGDSCGCLDAPVWSPDGSKIAYLHEFGFDRYGVNSAPVAVMNGDGSNRHDLPGSSGMGALSWSPDSTKIAYDTLSYGEKIDVANADGSGFVQLTSGTGPAWSPDGTKIAFVRADYTANTAGIFVMKPDGTNIEELRSFGPPADLNSPPGPSGLAWSPDGTQIAFSLSGVLQVMNADGSNLHELGTRTAGDEPSWSPDDSRIVFHDQTGLAVIGADGNGLHQLTEGPDQNPNWSPDGKTIVFASDRDDPYANYGINNETAYLELYLVDPDGHNLRPLSFTQPSAWLNAVTIHSSAGRPLSTVAGLPALRGNLTAATSAAFAGNVAAVSGVLASGAEQITLFQARSGAKLASVQVGTSRDFTVVGGDAHWIVFRLGTTISALNLRSRKVSRLATATQRLLGLSVSGRRLAWAENINGRGRIRSLQLPS